LTIGLVDDGDLKFPNNPPTQTWEGILGRGRVALSDSAGNNITSTGGALDIVIQNVSLAVIGPLTDAELRATPVSVVNSSTAQEVIEAVDVVTSFTWLDFGLVTERLGVLTYVSAGVGNTVTDTYAYTFLSPNYRLDGITRVVT